MPLADLIASPITGVRAFNGLPVDAILWNEAHNQHHLHRRLHALAAHRPGVVFGLEVVSSGGLNITIAPGVAIDSEGQVLVLSQPLTTSFKDRGLCYVVLTYQPQRDIGSAVALEGGGQDYFRLLEGRDIRIEKELPAGPHLELARVQRSSADKAVAEPQNPFDPGQDELNVLYRRLAFPHCFADLAVGEIGYVPTGGGSPTAWKPNRAGLIGLLRAGNGSGFHLDFLGPIPLGRDLPEGAREPALLYMAGAGGFTALSGAETERLSRLLQNGATLLGEAVGGSAEFVQSFRELTTKLNVSLKPVTSGSPLLNAHHVFPVPPSGATLKGELLASDDSSVVLSTFNYGGAWQGELDGSGAGDASGGARERVRQAQEFGLNLISAAGQRQRRVELSRIR